MEKHLFKTFHHLYIMISVDTEIVMKSYHVIMLIVFHRDYLLVTFTFHKCKLKLFFN